jgi:hypothetical protein
MRQDTKDLGIMIANQIKSRERDEETDITMRRIEIVLRKVYKSEWALRSKESLRCECSPRQQLPSKNN